MPGEGQWVPPPPRVPPAWNPALQQAVDEAARREADLVAFLAEQREMSHPEDRAVDGAGDW
jgi:hypothetical protein